MKHQGCTLLLKSKEDGSVAPKGSTSFVLLAHTLINILSLIMRRATMW